MVVVDVVVVVMIVLLPVVPWAYPIIAIAEATKIKMITTVAHTRLCMAPRMAG